MVAHEAIRLVFARLQPACFSLLLRQGCNGNLTPMPGVRRRFQDLEEVRMHSGPQVAPTKSDLTQLSRRFCVLGLPSSLEPGRLPCHRAVHGS